MPFEKQNAFWKLRATHGRDLIFQSPDALQAAAYEYFTAVEENPLKEEKAFSNGSTATLNRMRAFTLNGLFIFLDIDRKTWELYKGREEFSAVTEQIETIIYEQKFTGAAAGLLKENIIARQLSLADKTAFKFEDLSDSQLDELINKVVSGEKE